MSQQHSTSKRPRTLTQLAGRVFTVAITVVLALVAAVLVPVGAATAANAPVLDLEKTASKTTIEPGQEFSYTLKLTCSGLQEGCVDATITDTLPAEFDVTSIPASSNERDVTYDANTRLLTIKFKIPLSSPAGSTGLPAGSKAVQVGMRLPTETPVLQGQEISNTANATDTNGSPPQDATVKITANIPVAVRPVATKSWSPSSSIAQSGDESTVTLGIRNASSSSSDVRTLRVTDDSSATFDAFDVTSLGPINASPGYPDGADRVVVGVCTQPLGTPCADGDWTESAAQSGNGPFTAPAPLGTVTGVRFTFTNSNGDKLPYSADTATIDLGLKLRDNYRGSGDPIKPQNTLKVRNDAVPTAIDSATVLHTGDTVSATYSIQPDTIAVQATKNMFADNAGTWTANGNLVQGGNSGITATLNAKNLSAGPVKTLVISEPSTTTANAFDKIDLTNARFTWPAGATKAKLDVTCRSGSVPAPVNYNRAGSPATVTIADLGCGTGVAPKSVTLTYTGEDSAGNGTIASGAAGQLDLHGTVNDSAATGVLTNCFDATAITPPSASAASVGCKDVTVAKPAPGSGSFTKSTSGVSTIVPGQPMKFDVSFKNTGNVPLNGAYITDPVNPATDASPFDLVQLTSITSSTNPASSTQLYDPTVPGYVDYVGASPAVLARATGFKTVATEPLAVNATFKVSYTVVLRNLTPPTQPGAVFKNCATSGATGITSPQPACSTDITVKDASASASLRKLINPSSVLRPEPGLPSQTVNVAHTIFNGGPSYLKSLTFTDTSADFFSAVDFKTNMRVNFPPGANRVKVDACTTGCQDTPTATFINGTVTSSSTPGLPSGVNAADVQGVRVTFTNSNNGYELIPVDNYKPPTTGLCANANFCFDVAARQNLRGTTTPIPATLTNTSGGSYLWSGSPDPQPTPDSSAGLAITNGSAQIKFKKGPDSRLAPGDTAPFDLLLENTGTTAIVDPVINDPLPNQLTLEDAPGEPTARPFVISYPALPSGYPTLASDAVKYLEQAGSQPTDPKQGAKLTWTFTGWNLPPGGKVNIRIFVRVSPGVAAGDTIPNTGGAKGSNTFTCEASSPIKDGYCESSANIRVVDGNAVSSQKWTAGDAALGFYNTSSDQKVPTNDPSCPQYTLSGVTYTRFPCAAIVRPGGTLLQVIRMTNSGTNALTSAVAVDGLPVEGDTGVRVPSARGTQWSNRPLMSSPVTVLQSYSGITTEYTDATFPGPDFCTAQVQNPATSCPSGAFPNSSPSASTTGFRTTMDFPADAPLAPGQEVTLTWTMKAPLTLDTNQTTPAEWNSFAQKSTFGANSLAASEPLKTGSIMFFGTIKVSKDVVGVPDGVKLPAFDMAYKCTYNGEEVDSGNLTVKSGATEALPKQPSGSDCAIWEVDSQGADSPNVGEENAVHQIVPDPTDDPATVTIPITNTYAKGQLTIKKTVTGGAANVPLTPSGTVGGGNFPVEVDCKFPADGDQLPGFPKSFNLKDGEQVTIGDGDVVLPVASVCTVTETDNLNATSTTVAANGSEPTASKTTDVTIDPGSNDGSTVEFTNDYAAGSISLRKTISGPGAGLAKGPFTFQFACTYGGQDLAPIDRQVTVKNPTVKVSPLPIGALCDVTETNAGDSNTVVPNVVATGVEVKSDSDGPVTVNADNAYTTVPPCVLNVKALRSSKRIKSTGTTLLVKRVSTGPGCKPTVVKPSQVVCRPVHSTRGDRTYCKAIVKRSGRIKLKTFGEKRVVVKIRINAVPTSFNGAGKPNRKPASWSRTWRVG